MAPAGQINDGELLSRVEPAIRAEIEALIDRRVEQGTRAAMETSCRNLELAQEGGRIGIFDIDMATGDAAGSAMWAKLLGQSGATRSITRRSWIKLLHPDDRTRVLGEVAAASKTNRDASIEYRIVLPDGEVRWLHSRNLVARQPNGSATAYGTLQDITDRKSLEAKVFRAAYHDDLTGLPNRRFFMERLTAACNDASRESQVGLAIFDLDHLKLANDQYGHDAGDLLLQTTADRLQDVSGGNAIVARLGGDEFALLLRTDTRSRLRTVAEESLALLRRPVRFRGSAIDAGASVGGAVSSNCSTAASLLFRRADQALLNVKRGTRGAYLEYACPR